MNKNFNVFYNAMRKDKYVKFGVVTSSGDFRIRYGKIETLTPEYVTIFDSFRGQNRTTKLSQIVGVDES